MSFRPCPAPIRSQDEIYCPRCGIRWETGESKPGCGEGGLPADMPVGEETKDKLPWPKPKVKRVDP